MVNVHLVTRVQKYPYVLVPIAGAADFGPTRAPESSVKTRTERYPKISVKYIYASYPRYASTGM